MLPLKGWFHEAREKMRMKNLKQKFGDFRMTQLICRSLNLIWGGMQELTDTSIAGWSPLLKHCTGIRAH